MAKDKPIKTKAQAEALKGLWKACGFTREDFCKVAGYSYKSGRANNVYRNMEGMSRKAFDAVYDRIDDRVREVYALWYSTPVNDPSYSRRECECERLRADWTAFKMMLHPAPSLELTKLRGQDYLKSRIRTAVEEMDERDLKLVVDLCERLIDK